MVMNTIVMVGLVLDITTDFASSKTVIGTKSDGSKEYCSGYTDRHGQWNNGFFCPKWGKPDEVYCCGPDNHRFCCPKKKDLHQSNSIGIDRLHSPIYAGLIVTSLIVLTAVCIVICYCCPGCVIYKRRKGRSRSEYAVDSVRSHLANRPANIGFEITLPSTAAAATGDIYPSGASNPPPYEDKDAPPHYSAIFYSNGCPLQVVTLCGSDGHLNGHRHGHDQCDLMTGRHISQSSIENSSSSTAIATAAAAADDAQQSRESDGTENDGEHSNKSPMRSENSSIRWKAVCSETWKRPSCRHYDIFGADCRSSNYELLLAPSGQIED